MCIDEVTEHYGPNSRAIFTPEILAAQESPDLLAQQFPTMKDLLDHNRAGASGAS